MKVDRSKYRKDVKLPNGDVFQIRRLDPFDYMRSVGSLPAKVLPAVSKQLTQVGESEDKDSPVPEQKQDQEKMVGYFLSHAVVSPKIWFGEDEDCPDDQISINDLSVDKWILVSEIMTFSFSENTMEQYTNFFRGTGASAPGHDGKEVREDTVGAGPDGARSPVVQP